MVLNIYMYSNVYLRCEDKKLKMAALGSLSMTKSAYLLVIHCAEHTVNAVFHV
jgi:hypothetical protein